MVQDYKSKLWEIMLSRLLFLQDHQRKELPSYPVYLIPTDLPFQYKRLQFPIKVSFVITINKAWGQTFQGALIVSHIDSYM